MTARILDGAAVAARDPGAGGRPGPGACRRTASCPRLEVILVGDDPASRVVRRLQGQGVPAGRHPLDHPPPPRRDRRRASSRALIAGAQRRPRRGRHPAPAAAAEAAGRARRSSTSSTRPRTWTASTRTNVGLLHQGRPAFVPCTPAGIIELLGRAGVALAGRRAVVLGRSEIVGKPMAALLLARHATVTVCHSRTGRPRGRVPGGRRAGGGRGQAGARDARSTSSPGAVVVDVGVNRVEDAALVARLYPGDAERQAQLAKRGYTLVGDVDFTAVREVAGGDHAGARRRRAAHHRRAACRTR